MPEQPEQRIKKLRGPRRKPLALVLLKGVASHQQREYRTNSRNRLPTPLHPENCPDPLKAKFLYKERVDEMFMAGWERLRRDLGSTVDEIRKAAQREARLIRKEPKDYPIVVYFATRTHLTPQEVANALPKSAREARHMNYIYPTTDRSRAKGGKISA